MKKTKLDNEAVESAVGAFLQSALNQPGDEISQLRERNLRYYNAEATDDLAPPELNGESIDGRSTFVATDVADTVEWMLPQLLRLFVSSDNAVEFTPRTPEQEEQARIVTEYINWLFYVANDGQEILYDWFKDCLLQLVGWAKVWVEDENNDERREFAGLAPEQAAMLEQDGWTIEDVAQDEQGALYFTALREDTRRRIKVAAVAPGEMRVDPNAQWGGDPLAIAQVYERRRFELEEDGFDLEDFAHGNTREDTAELGSLPWQSGGGMPESHQVFEVAETYIKLDRDGDGVAEWLKVETIGGRIALRDGEPSIEQVDDHPFVWICPIPRAHAFFGDCPASQAAAPQKLRTNVVRAIDDNLFLSVNSRTYVNRNAGVDIGSLLDSRAGGVVTGDVSASEAIQPLAQPSLTGPAYQFNEWIEGWRENHTGFTRYSQGTDANALNKTATGVSIITQKADMRMELMARNIAVGVKRLFAKLLKLAVDYQDREEMIQVSGQWVPINPSEFSTQFNVKIKVGLGTGTKEQTMQRVMALMQMQEAGMKVGVVRPEHIAESIKLGVEANEFKQPERFVDPQPQNAPKPEQMQQMQQQLEQVGKENQQLKQQIESKQGDLAIKHAELELKKQELAGKQFEAEQRLQLGWVDSQRADMALEQPQILEQMQEQIGALTQVVQMLLEAQGGQMEEPPEQDQFQESDEPPQGGFSLGDIPEAQAITDDGIENPAPYQGPAHLDPGELGG